VVVNNLYAVSVAIQPNKTNPPLLVDTNAALAGSISAQCFKSITWQNLQILQASRPVEDEKLTSCRPLEPIEPAYPLVEEEGLCALAPKRLNHSVNI
jgi:hypothetical protein